jgi:hypothetical protein
MAIGDLCGSPIGLKECRDAGDTAEVQSKPSSYIYSIADIGTTYSSSFILSFYISFIDTMKISNETHDLTKQEFTNLTTKRLAKIKKTEV